jgi:S1-C subfamily serine protease
MFTKLGSFLGSVAFVMLMAVGFHVYSEEAPPPPPSVPTLVQQLDNVVALQTLSGDYCSGWILKGTHTIVTAAHCVEKGDPTQPVEVLIHGDPQIHVFHIEKIGDDTLQQAPDLMTLTTNDTTIKWPAGLSVCTFKPYYGEALNLIGGPLAFTDTITTGKVSNPSRDMDDNVHSPFGKFIQYDGSLMPGNSGGPAIDAQTGCVMGVAEMLFMKQEGVAIFMIPLLTPITDLANLK